MFIGITGSAGKTTTKDLIARIMQRHFSSGRNAEGTLNGPYDVARLVLATRPWHAYCVSEIAITNEAGIDVPISLFHPTIGVVTAIGGEHVAAYGDLDGVANEKAKLIRSLPPNGTAVLNADDERVLAMRPLFSGRTITFGIAQDAMVRGEVVEASWPERLSLRVTWNGVSTLVVTQLCGTHWVPAVLGAMACAAAIGIPMEAAAKAISSVEPFEGRMSPVRLADGVTFIRDDWKAPFWSIPNVLDFVSRARATRKVVVIGTLSDYSGPYTPRYVRTAEQALAVADCVLFVGPRASACLRAKQPGETRLHAFPSLRDASDFLSRYLRPGDLVLLKGSIRTDHLERLLLARSGSVECWRIACKRAYFCGYCKLLHVPSEIPIAITKASETGTTRPGALALSAHSSNVFVIGLGNPGDRYVGTRHNVGHLVVERLAEQFGGAWVREGELAVTSRLEFEGQEIVLVKLLSSMNEAGTALRPLANTMGFSLEECILVHDDLDLPVGTVRARLRGGDGGHRGIQSILQAFQDDKVRRVKVGIGKPATGESVADFVLSTFPSAQLVEVEAASCVAAERVLELVHESAVARARGSAKRIAKAASP
jgi:aminoacyl-tRNA hydrolase